jgi:hypothetical protein
MEQFAGTWVLLSHKKHVMFLEGHSPVGCSSSQLGQLPVHWLPWWPSSPQRLQAFILRWSRLGILLLGQGRLAWSASPQSQHKVWVQKYPCFFFGIRFRWDLLWYSWAILLRWNSNSVLALPLFVHNLNGRFESMGCIRGVKYCSRWEGTSFKRFLMRDWYGLEFNFGPASQKHFWRNKLLGWLLHVTGWHMSNTSQNKSIIQTIKVLSTLSNHELRVAQYKQLSMSYKSY